MRSRLIGVANAMHQSQLIGIENRTEKFEGRMQGGKAVAGTDGFVIPEGGVVRIPRVLGTSGGDRVHLPGDSLVISIPAGVLAEQEGRAVGGIVSRVQDWN